MTTCKCAARCGDDDDVQAGRMLGCATWRAMRHPTALQARINNLRAALASVLVLLDRMEPEVSEEDRATDEEWIAIKAAGQAALKADGEVPL